MKLSKSFVREDECAAVGVSPAKVKQIAELLDRAVKLANDQRITIFGGAGSGSLRKHRNREDRAFILASIAGPFDGGDGGDSEDENGLLRGE